MTSIEWWSISRGGIINWEVCHVAGADSGSAGGRPARRGIGFGSWRGVSVQIGGLPCAQAKRHGGGRNRPNGGAFVADVGVAAGGVYLSVVMAWHLVYTVRL